MRNLSEEGSSLYHIPELITVNCAPSILRCCGAVEICLSSFMFLTATWVGSGCLLSSIVRLLSPFLRSSFSKLLPLHNAPFLQYIEFSILI